MSLILSGTNGLSDVDGSAATPAIRGTDTNTGIFFPAADTIAFAEGGAESMRLDSNGNLGLGGTPKPYLNPNYNALDMHAGRTVLMSSSGTPQTNLLTNGYYDSTDSRFEYSQTGFAASNYVQQSGAHLWYTAASGTAGNAITFTQAMTLDASGRLGIGTTSPQEKLSLEGSGSQYMRVKTTTTNADMYFGITSSSVGYVGTGGSDPLAFYTGGTERGRISSGGNWGFGDTSPSANYKVNVLTSGASGSFNWYQGANQAVAFYAGGTVATGFSTANACGWFSKDSVTNRSINCAGTVNQNGADYAEYMTKADDFVVAKGDVVGINADGKLTNVFADAISFCVKSTDPGLVGGDSWFTEEIPKDEEGSYQKAGDAEYDAWATRLEAARAQVDRIAFCGQVPVNVTGATAGQYIVPVNDNGAIKGEAVSNPTFEQYQQAVGKVIAIEQDGRARIIVKVA